MIILLDADVCIDFTRGRAPVVDRLRAQPIGLRDMMTAATALVHDCAVATRNVREFSRVPGLRVEDWSLPA